MLSLTLLILPLLQGTTLGNPIDFPLAERAHYNYDNCLHAMTNEPSFASSFCSTFIQPTSYVTVTPTVTVSGTTTFFPTTTMPGPVIPTHISDQCALTTSPPLTSRLSSACSCISIFPASSTVTLTSYTPATTVINVVGPPPCDDVVSRCSAPNGVLFDEILNAVLIGSALTDVTGVTDYLSCISTCATTTGCAALNFYPTEDDSPSGIQCRLLASSFFAGAAPGSNAAVRRS